MIIKIVTTKSSNNAGAYSNIKVYSNNVEYKNYGDFYDNCSNARVEGFIDALMLLEPNIDIIRETKIDPNLIDN